MEKQNLNRMLERIRAKDMKYIEIPIKFFKKNYKIFEDLFPKDADWKTSGYILQIKPKMQCDGSVKNDYELYFGCMEFSGYRNDLINCERFMDALQKEFEEPYSLWKMIKRTISMLFLPFRRQLDSRFIPSVYLEYYNSPGQVVIFSVAIKDCSRIDPILQQIIMENHQADLYIPAEEQKPKKPSSD